MRPAIEVTDADREYAAHVWTALDCGQLDTYSLQIFFARHRLAEREAVVKWLRELWRTDMGEIECLDIADDIEAGEHLK